MTGVPIRTWILNSTAFPSVKFAVNNFGHVLCVHLHIYENAALLSSVAIQYQTFIIQIWWYVLIERRCTNKVNGLVDSRNFDFLFNVNNHAWKFNKMFTEFLLNTVFPLLHKIQVLIFYLSGVFLNVFGGNSSNSSWVSPISCKAISIKL